MFYLVSHIDYFIMNQYSHLHLEMGSFQIVSVKLVLNIFPQWQYFIVLQIDKNCMSKQFPYISETLLKVTYMTR